MLKPAFLYKNQLNETYHKIIYNEKYKFLIEDVWEYNIKIEESDANSIQLVSIDENENVIGFLQANLNREINHVTSLEVINFNEINYTYSKDFNNFIRDLTEKFGFKKITFEVILGSPYEKLYDKHLKRFNGRVVGIKKAEVRLADGKYYDVKIYEIFKAKSVL